MTRHRVSPRLLAGSGVVVAGVLAFLTAAVGRVLDMFSIGSDPSRADHVHAAVGFAVVGLAMVALAVVARVTLDAPRWALAVLVVLVVVCAGAAALDLVAARDAVDDEDLQVWWRLRYLLVLPSDWPLLAYLVVAPLRARGRSSLAPR